MTEDSRDRPEKSSANGEEKGHIPSSIYALGFVSFFTDISSDMIYPILPFFLSAVLGAGTVAIGLIEGVAESTASVMNLFSGMLSDRLRKRKGLALLGYALAAAMKPLVGFAAVWPHVFAARFLDRLGKGIRTSPRDALVAQEVAGQVRGRAFGIQRAMDHAGAVAGPLLTMAILYFLGSPLIGSRAHDIPEANYRLLFFIAFIPGLLSVLFLWLGVKEKAPPPLSAKPLPAVSLQVLKGPFGRYCLVATLFAVGNSSNVFLLLRAENLGWSIGLVPAGYLLIYLGAALSSVPAGIISDRLGRKSILTIGYFVSAAVYFGFALAKAPAAVWALFGLYGIYLGLTDGMQRAYASDLAPREIWGTALGTFNTLAGLALLPASLIAGILWQISPAWPFWFGGATGLLAALLLWRFPSGRRQLGQLHAD